MNKFITLENRCDLKNIKKVIINIDCIVKIVYNGIDKNDIYFGESSIIVISDTDMEQLLNRIDYAR
jgi:hypothetical protein